MENDSLGSRTIRIWHHLWTKKGYKNSSIGRFHIGNDQVRGGATRPTWVDIICGWVVKWQGNGASIILEGLNDIVLEYSLKFDIRVTNN